MDLIQDICVSAQDLFVALGCRWVDIGTQKVLKAPGKENYYRISYVKGLDGFIIESAFSKMEVKNNVFEDDDIYPLNWGKDKILSVLGEDLLKHYL